GGGDATPRLPVDGRLCVGGALLHAAGSGQHFGINKMAAPLLGDQKPLIDKLLEGQNHSAARHAQPLRQNAAGGQRQRGCDLSVEDGGYDGLPDLCLKCLTGIGGDPEQTGPDRRVSARRHLFPPDGAKLSLNALSKWLAQRIQDWSNDLSQS